MIIGLYDYDFNYRPRKFGFSVELMQLASYYEANHHTVKFLQKEEISYPCDKTIIYSRYSKISKKHYISTRLLRNIEFIGPAFTNGVELPIGVPEITQQPIHNYYYKPVISFLLTSGQMTELQARTRYERKWIKLFNDELIDLNSILTGEKYFIEDVDILLRPEFDKVFSTLSIFPKYYRFSNSLEIRDEQSLLRFKKLIDAHFTRLKGVLKFDNLEETQKFITEHKQLITELNRRLEIFIFYDKSNLYAEDFYVEEWKKTIDFRTWLNKNEIYINFVTSPPAAPVLLQSVISTFTDERQYRLRDNFYQAFEYLFRSQVDIIHKFHIVINRKPELYNWIKKTWR